MPKIVDRDQYRKELLEKSFDLFAEKGYASITMREIAQGLDVSTGTLYHYFPSKEALFLQLVEELTVQDILSFRAEVGDAKTLSERIEAFISFVAKHEDYFIKQLLIFVDFHQQQDRAQMRNNEILRRSSEQTVQVLTDYLQIHDPIISDFIYCWIQGLILERLFEGEKVSFAIQGELLKKMLTAYLQIEGQPSDQVQSSNVTKRVKKT